MTEAKINKFPRDKQYDDVQMTKTQKQNRANVETHESNYPSNLTQKQDFLFM